MKKIILIFLLMTSLGTVSSAKNKTNIKTNVLVFQSDFGLNDGAVSAMKGVAIGVNSDLKIYDITHEIPAYNIWDASYRLFQTAEYWPKGTVFVSVVDPGVGTDRKSVVLRTNNDQYFVTPDNGTLTLIAEKFGIKEIREISEVENRRKNSEKSYTFHGRDVYAYTGAKLASGMINFEDVGPKLPNKVEIIKYQKAKKENGDIFGNISALDVQYGNVWSNIPREISGEMDLVKNEYMVEIFNGKKRVFKERIPFVNSFGDVKEGKNCMYFNSLDNLSFAINVGNFASKYKIGHGELWSVKIIKIK